MIVRFRRSARAWQACPELSMISLLSELSEAGWECPNVGKTRAIPAAINILEVLADKF